MNKLRRIATLVLMAACITPLLGGSCNVKTPDIPRAIEGGKQISQDFKDGATAMAEGLAAAAGVDPAGINRLLEEVKTKDELIAMLQEEISRARARPDVVNLTGTSRLQIELVSYAGTIRLHGWVDSSENRFYSGDGCLLVDREVSLDILFDIARTIRDGKDLGSPWGNRLKNKAQLQWTMTTPEEIDAAYKRSASESLKRFQSKPRITPSVACVVQDVGVRLQGKGEHRIFLQVKPEANDVGGRWNVEYQIVTWEEGRKDFTLKKVVTGRFDSEEHPNSDVGQALPAVEIARFFVHYEG